MQTKTSCTSAGHVQGLSICPYKWKKEGIFGLERLYSLSLRSATAHFARVKQLQEAPDSSCTFVLIFLLAVPNTLTDFGHVFTRAAQPPTRRSLAHSAHLVEEHSVEEVAQRELRPEHLREVRDRRMRTLPEHEVG